MATKFPVKTVETSLSVIDSSTFIKSNYFNTSIPADGDRNSQFVYNNNTNEFSPKKVVIVQEKQIIYATGNGNGPFTSILKYDLELNYLGSIATYQYNTFEYCKFDNRIYLARADTPAIQAINSDTGAVIHTNSIPSIVDKMYIFQISRNIYVHCINNTSAYFQVDPFAFIPTTHTYVDFCLASTNQTNQTMYGITADAKLYKLSGPGEPLIFDFGAVWGITQTTRMIYIPEFNSLYINTQGSSLVRYSPDSNTSGFISLPFTFDTPPLFTYMKEINKIALSGTINSSANSYFIILSLWTGSIWNTGLTGVSGIVAKEVFYLPHKQTVFFSKSDNSGTISVSAINHLTIPKDVINGDLFIANPFGISKLTSPGSGYYLQSSASGTAPTWVANPPRQQMCYIITPTDVSNGYFNLTAAPTNGYSVQAFIKGGSIQVNQTASAVGVTPDFTIINNNAKFIIRNGTYDTIPVTGLSNLISSNDILIISW